MNRFNQFWHYASKTFSLDQDFKAFRNSRCDPQVPTPPVSATLFLGAAFRIPSFLQLQNESLRKGWQKLVEYTGQISDDVMDYTLERYELEDIRQAIVRVVTQLKRNKALEQAKTNGLLVLSIDANEQFNSRHRCCKHCSIRHVKIKTAEGEKEVEEYYHRQVYAHIQGPTLSVILDVEPILPGEEECRSALRLLARIRRLYGPRFIDVISADAWYAKGPFMRAVQKMGWGVICVLKQERYEIYQEATSLMEQSPLEVFEENKRRVELKEVNDLTFTEVKGKVRVVSSHEQWKQNNRIGQKKISKEMETEWRWVATEELEGYPAKFIWAAGHARWGIENHAFNELTQHYGLTHCPHHEPVAIMARLLFLILAFIVFEAFCRLNGKLLRLGKASLKEICRQMDLSLERWEDLIPMWSG